MIFLASISMIIPMIMIFLNLLIHKKNTFKRETNSPFECGFDPNNSPRLPFSIRFFLIAVIFLIFDIEITLILPIPFLLPLNNPSIWLAILNSFVLILIVGLLLEWKNGALNWSK